MATATRPDAVDSEGPFRLTPLPDRLLTPGDLATLFGVGKSSIRGWVRDGRLPAPLRIGRAPRWAPESIRAHLDRWTRQHA